MNHFPEDSLVLTPHLRAAPPVTPANKPKKAAPLVETAASDPPRHGRRAQGQAPLRYDRKKTAQSPSLGGYLHENRPRKRDGRARHPNPSPQTKPPRRNGRSSPMRSLRSVYYTATRANNPSGRSSPSLRRSFPPESSAKITHAKTRICSSRQIPRWASRGSRWWCIRTSAVRRSRRAASTTAATTGSKSRSTLTRLPSVLVSTARLILTDSWCTARCGREEGQRWTLRYRMGHLGARKKRISYSLSRRPESPRMDVKRGR